MKPLSVLASALLFLTQCSPIHAPQEVAVPAPQPMPAGLCYLDTVAPSVKVDLKYCGNDNFVGRPIDGYTGGKRAILRKDAAQAVLKAQQELETKGLGLLIWDAYRPHRALADFYAWSKTADDSTRAEFYPNITKRGIYENRYIGHTSEHSWG
ncbi:MAG: M15 family metallopeptidase, partial [Akkermansia sp.]|nr:M15 family metallopeptidase [Akkermansia sp.]